MATNTLVNERLPGVLGIPPATLERLLRALREAKIIPQGRPGGGKGAAHLSEYPLAYVMLGCAALRQSEAPDAVMKLRSLPFYGSFNPPKDVATPLPTIEDQLADTIRKAGAAYLNGCVWSPRSLASLRSWELQMSLDPLFAVIEVETTGGLTRHIYAVDPSPRPGLRRQTILTGDVLISVAELLVDTERQLASPTPSFLDPAPAKATPEGNNAGDPRQGVPASLSDQPTPMGPAASPPRKVSAKTKIFKDAPLAGLVTADE